ncbi:Protein kilA [Xenorhabdus bovienii str. puntauvense]|uniref:Protein kilA n=1 Tax=Xenorhabdus bovienii str. puntauvense TaxID=1398201 RepID=A0A077N930_XENBV|nr:Protein kilA [Xenorhabdus bovienii str. puntauvense]
MRLRSNKDETSKGATNEASKSSNRTKQLKITSTHNKESDKVNIANNNLPVIAGVEITTDAEGRFNLNALHKASGTGSNKAPNQWLRTKQAQELIDELGSNPLKDNQAANMRLGRKVIESVHGGTSPGTFAHELLAVSYAGWISPSFQLQVNQTFIDYRSGKLVDQVQVQIPQSLPEALRLAADLAEQKAELEHKVEEMKPDVAALERIAKSDGSMCVTDAAKQLQVKPKSLFDLMSHNKWIYRRMGTSWVGYQEKIQQRLIEHKVTVVIKPDGEEKTVSQVRITPKGISKLAKMLSVDKAA